MNDRHARPDVESVLQVGKTGKTGGFRRFFRIVITLAVVAGLAALGWMWFFGGSTQTVRYTTEPAVRGDLTVVVTATGSVEPTNLVEVSSELSGTVPSVTVDYNSEVTAGQVPAPPLQPI